MECRRVNDSSVKRLALGRTQLLVRMQVRARGE